MTQKKRRQSLLSKILAHVFHWRVGYIVVLVTLIVLYPLYVSDGQKWTYVSKFGIRVPLKYEIHGIDISHHNDLIDWEKIKKGRTDKTEVDFCFIKATEGMELEDEDFNRNWQKAKRTGLIRGAYHFYTPGSNPVKQADNFVKNVRLESGDFAPVLDFEIEGSRISRKELKKNVRVWLNLIENHYKIKPIIYTNRSIYQNYVKGEFDDYPLWISDYKSEKLDGYDNANLRFWQHSQTGKLAGIRGRVDFNVFMGSLRELEDVCLD